jgi:co-chaperonin GroES (HSP10)
MDIKIKTFKGRVILEPLPEPNSFGGFQVEERNITDASKGICVAFGNDIDDIKIGDEIWYAKANREVILIADTEYHVVPYARIFYSPTTK